MLAPEHTISFSARETSADTFLDFIMKLQKIDREKAGTQLAEFCSLIKSIKKSDSWEIPSAGSFTVGVDGHLFFTRTELPHVYMPDVPLKKVIHPNRTHQIVVGDSVKESAFVLEAEESVIAHMTGRWWIWAAALALIGISSLFYFHYTQQSLSFSGNGVKIIPASSSSNYTLIK